MFDDDNTLARKRNARYHRAQSLRMFFALVLLLIGLAIVVAVLLQAYHLLHGPDDAYLLRKIAFIDASQIVISWSNGGKVSLPPNLLMVSGYVIAVFLLLIAATLAGTLIRVGASLLMSVDSPRSPTPANTPTRTLV
jgi:hypothetical protein